MSTTTAVYSTPIPPPTTWTLLFKFHKLTLVLPNDPVTPFLTIRHQIHTILRTTPNLASNTHLQAPASEDEIQFAALDKTSSRPVQVDLENDGEEKVKVERSMIAKNCPKGMGLRDGGIVLMRWGDAVERDEWPFRIPVYDDVDDTAGDGGGGTMENGLETGMEVEDDHVGAASGSARKGKGRG